MDEDEIDRHINQQERMAEKRRQGRLRQGSGHEYQQLKAALDNETTDMTREEKLQALKHPLGNDGPTTVYPEGRKPWSIEAVDEDTGTVTISFSNPRDGRVTSEVDVDNVFRCGCRDQWVVGWCMQCASDQHDTRGDGQ